MDFMSFIAPISQIVNKMLDLIPDANAKQKAQLEIETAIAIANIDAQKAQLDINKTEAASPNWFVAGWRPGFGWLGVVILGFNYIIAPLLTWTTMLAGASVKVPALDAGGEIMPLITLMLGGVAARTFEKVNRAAR